MENKKTMDRRTYKKLVAGCGGSYSMRDAIIIIAKELYYQYGVPATVAGRVATKMYDLASGMTPSPTDPAISAYMEYTTGYLPTSYKVLQNYKRADIVRGKLGKALQSYCSRLIARSKK